jgi:hypothetical protein
MERSEIRGRARANAAIPDYASLHPGYRTGSWPVGQNTCGQKRPTICQGLPAKIFHFTEIRIYRTHPGPSQGADRDRHEPRAGVRWTRRRRARRGVAGRTDVREQWPARERHDVDSVFAWLRGRAHASLRIPSEDVRGRRSRVVLTPESGVKSCGDAISPTGRAHQPSGKATGAIGFDSPRRARRKP